MGNSSVIFQNVTILNKEYYSQIFFYKYHSNNA